MSEPLTPTEIAARLTDRSDWSFDADRNALYREFTFGDFAAAFGFMTRAALAAERADHHPDWTNVYNRVSVHLLTHSAGGVTEKDFALAEAMDGIFRG